MRQNCSPAYSGCNLADDEFDALCRELLGQEALHFMGIELLRQSGQLDEALRSLANLPVTARKDLRFFLSAAWIYIEQGDAERAYDCAHPAFQADQSDATSDAYITSLTDDRALSVGRKSRWLRWLPSKWGIVGGRRISPFCSGCWSKALMRVSVS